MYRLEEIPLTPNEYKSQPDYGSALINNDKQYSNNQTGFFGDLARRLNYPKQLFNYRRLIVLYSVLLAFIGLILSFALTELNISYISLNLKLKNIFIYVCIMKVVISISTVILVILVLINNYLDIKIEMMMSDVKDWKMMIKWQHILKVISEVLICCIHPLPIFHEELYEQVIGYSTKKHKLQYWARIDGILSMFMFTRIYLLVRLFIVRSNFHHNPTVETFGVINRTAINTKFLFKSWINLYTGYILLVLIGFIIFWGGWSFRVCEWSIKFHMTPEMFNSMYFTAITFLSIGYGDYFPVTNCGKISASITAILGAACTALTVAIVSEKLNLNSNEKYLHNFVNNFQLEMNIRETSARIIQESWLIHQYSKGKIRRKLSIDRLKRDLFNNLRRIPGLREQHSHLSDESINYQHIDSAQNGSRLMLQEMNKKVDIIQWRLEVICNRLINHRRKPRYV